MVIDGIDYQMDPDARRSAVVQFRNANTEEQGMADLLMYLGPDGNMVNPDYADILELRNADYEKLRDFVIGQIYPLART